MPGQQERIAQALLVVGLAMLPLGSCLAEPCKNHYILEGDSACRGAVVGAWLPVSNLKAARSRHQAVLLRDGTVLVIGGWNSGAFRVDSEIYDPVADMWHDGGPLMSLRSGFTTTVLHDGRVLVAGGVVWTVDAPCCEPVTVAEIYDPATRTWSATGPMVAGRSGHTATLLRDGRVLIAGGDTASERSKSELFDPLSLTFSPTGALVVPRYEHTATLLDDGTVLVARGSNDGDLSTTLTPAERYDPITGEWRLTGSSARGSVFHAAARLADGRVLVTGGYPGGMGGAAPVANAEIYDPTSERWTRAEDMPNRREFHTAVTLGDGRVLLAGGIVVARDFRTLLSDSVITFDPASGRWVENEPLAFPRYDHTATLLNDGRVLIVGGTIMALGVPRAALFSVEAMLP